MTTNELEAKVEGLVKKLKSKKLADKRGASFALTKIEAEALPYLEQSYDKERYDIKVVIVKCMGDMHQLNVGPTLIKALSGSHVEIRKAAAVALSKIKDPTSVRALCQALTDSNSDVRKEAIWALFKIKDREAVVPLTQKLYDSDKYVRVRAATILGEFGDERAVEPLIDALKDDPEVCVEAIRSLTKIGGTKALSAINQFESHSDIKVREVLNEVKAKTLSHSTTALAG
jgi:hypothetical protein